MNESADSNELLTAALVEAAGRLQDSGDFLPFAVAMLSDGTLDFIRVESNEAGAPLEEIINSIVAELRVGVSQDAYRATAVVFNHQFTEPDGAAGRVVSITIEERAESEMTCCLPYTIDGDEIDFDEPYASMLSLNVFGRDDEAEGGDAS